MKLKLVILLSAITAIFACAIGLTACSKDEQLRFTLSSDGTYYICESGRSTGSDAEIVIPSVYKDKPVKEIGHFGCDNLESVTIPDSVITIGEDAFSGSPKLKNVTIGSGVKEIAKFAFGGCTALESITIPDNVTTIGESAFEQCHNLKNVSLGKGITAISGYTFKSCENLKNIVLPDTVEIIDDWAFCLSGIENITIGNGVTTIGDNAFRECTNLVNIIIPDTVKAIKDWAFCGCSGLKTIVLGSGVETFGQYVFRNCTNFQSLYFKGSYEYWAEHIATNYGSEIYQNAVVYFYSETRPAEDGNYWRYVNGEITVWENE
ncbi:MAG: leucine-rich repeat domain-containing protein [Clostridia bacterium]|nr:leucine-rich repeat domain-containing protein [Clostridia bacterium]